MGKGAPPESPVAGMGFGCDEDKLIITGNVIAFSNGGSQRMRGKEAKCVTTVIRGRRRPIIERIVFRKGHCPRCVIIQPAPSI